MKKPYATDWEDQGRGIQYSPSLNLWYRDGMVYNQQSAEHNGITGPGKQLADMLGKGCK